MDYVISNFRKQAVSVAEDLLRALKVDRTAGTKLRRKRIDPTETSECVLNGTLSADIRPGVRIRRVPDLVLSQERRWRSTEARRSADGL